MPFPLHKVAGSLLALIRGRTLGMNPNQFSELVHGTVDLRDYYETDLLIPNAGAATVGALANLFDDQVITSALAFRSVGARLVVGAAAATNLTIAWGFIDNTGFRFPLGSQFFAATAAAQIVEVGCPVPSITLPAQWGTYARASGTAAGADHSLQVANLAVNYSLFA